MNKTRKNRRKSGGALQDYSPNEIYTRLNNYLAASYAIKEATEDILSNIQSKVLKIDYDDPTYKIQTSNAEDFLKVSDKLLEITHKLKNNLLHLTNK